MIERLKYDFREKSGQALVEAVAAIGVLIVGVVGALAFLSSSLSLNLLVTNQYTATYLAMEQLEVVKNIIDIKGISSVNEGTYYVDYNSDSLVSVSGGKKVVFNDNGFYVGEGSGQTTPFTKQVIITPISGEDGVKVGSIVRWLEKGSEYKVELEDHFYEWRG